MKTSSTLVCLFVLMGAVPFAPPAEAQSPEARSVAHRLVVRSGLSVQLRSFDKQIDAQFTAQGPAIPAEVLAMLRPAAKEAFRSDVLLEDVTAALAAKMQVADMEKAIAWLETDVGKRVTLAEELASLTLDEASLKDFGERIKAKPPGAKRGKLLKAILDGTHGIDSAVRMFESSALGVAIGMDSTQPVQKRVGAARLRSQLKAALPSDQIRASMQQVLPVLYAYTYRDVSDADLAAYDAFLRGPAGKRYHLDVMEVVEGAMVRASMRMGQLVDQSGSKRGT